MRRRFGMSAATLPILAAMIPAVALADGYFRCGQSLITSETSVTELVRKCGAPASKDVSTEDVRVAVNGPWHSGTEKIGATRVEKWHYLHTDRIDGMVVTVVDGKILGIESAAATP
ncbi:MAG: DUF2845 domain-containing protein [Proteobacteria bacterium]|nr:DUF2845 domain-containing protein [Pseudomonadota bacterium]